MIRHEPMNCKIGDSIECIQEVRTYDMFDFDNGSVLAEGSKCIVVNIVGYGIDIIMPDGGSLRVINSDFPKYFKVI